MLSLSQKIKQEILNSEEQSHKSETAFFSSIIRCLLSIEIKGSVVSSVVRTENPLIKQQILEFISRRFMGSLAVSAKDNRLEFLDSSLLFSELKISTENGEFSFLPPQEFLDAPLVKSTIRGFFVAVGTITTAKSNSLEFAFTNSSLALQILKHLQQNKIPAKEKLKEGKHIVFIKQRDGILKTLNLLAVPLATSEFIKALSEKELKKDINRKVNFEKANTEKTVRVSNAQLIAIEKIKALPEFDSLSDKLKQAAGLRLQNPTATLAQLAALAGISKSGIRNRLAKLLEGVLVGF